MGGYWVCALVGVMDSGGGGEWADRVGACGVGRGGGCIVGGGRGRRGGMAVGGWPLIFMDGGRKINFGNGGLELEVWG